METKQCSCCKQVKPVSDFHKDKQKSDGFTSCCKLCRKEETKKLYNKPEVKIKKKAYNTEWKRNNKDKVALQVKKYRLNHVEELRKYDLERAKKNPGYFAAKTKKRYAAKLKRTPKWLSSVELKQIETEYLLAAWCSSVMGEKYHVDHIVPLQGKKVSGLHVPWNLQVIPARDNIRKGNNYDQSEWES